MWLSEQILFRLAKRLYHTDLAHSDETREAHSNPDSWLEYRRREVDRVLAGASLFGVDFTEKAVLDLGCGEGVISEGVLEAGAREVVGVDISAELIENARSRCASVANLSFRQSEISSIPLENDAFDLIISFDVFEHVSQPGQMLEECRRVLKPGGQLLIGTWGWYHPFAPHLWDTLPVPWAHVFFSEKTMLRTCRRVYNAPWYRPTQWDFDDNGRRKDKYGEEAIDTDWLNKLLLRDFEELFDRSGFEYKMVLQPFGSRHARWTRVFLRNRFLREYVTSFFWALLKKGR